MGSRMSRAERRRKVHRRIRPHVLGTGERPRLCVFRTARHTYAQLIDDAAGHTLGAASTLKLDGKKAPNGGNVEAARTVGAAIAATARGTGSGAGRVRPQRIHLPRPGQSPRRSSPRGGLEILEN